MQHLFGNLLCAIDIETTGTTPYYHEIVELAVIQLDNKLDPTGIPFTLELIPKRPENIDLEALKIQKREFDPEPEFLDQVVSKRQHLHRLFENGIDSDRGADYFVEWFEKLCLPPKKRIMMVGHNLFFDRVFLLDWLGPKTFDYIFDPRIRDTMSMTLYENDISSWRGERYPYAKSNLRYVANLLSVQQFNAHTALDDALTTAKIYKSMVRKHI